MSKELDLKEYFNALTKEQLVERMYKTEMAMKQNVKTTIECAFELKRALDELEDYKKSDASKEQSSIYYFNEYKRVEREIKELKKRDTPLKVVIEEEPFYSIDNGDYIDNQPSMSIKGYKCPNCNNYVHKYNDYRYCYRCGQRLNWSDEE